jgi:hypothetical protein
MTMGTLDNGYTLVAHQRDIVLAVCKKPYGVEYAVWSLSPEGNTVHGMYTRSLRNAVDHFYWKLENSTGVERQPKMKEN